VYARLSETYDAAESVPTQLERGTDHAQRRGWLIAATFKDDGVRAATASRSQQPRPTLTRPDI
jgi:hypothetical protein